MKMDTKLPVAVIGAGPVGLAAAAQLVSRGLTPMVFERGETVGASMLEWGHVRLFSPWAYTIDSAARGLLEATGWTAPAADAVPTGCEIVDTYLRPLAALPQLEGAIRLGAEVTSISRLDLDKVSDRGRDSAPFVVRWTDRKGEDHSIVAGAVLDATGTWRQPNPMGVDGLPVIGERELRGLIDYGIPDVLGPRRAEFEGKTVLVVGSGHSAINVALALLRLQAEAPATRVIWALRRNRIDRLLGGGLNDQLPERGALGLAAKQAIDSGRLQVLAPFAADRLAPAGTGLAVAGRLDRAGITLLADRIVVATGFRPDLGMVSELRVAVDPSTEAPPALSPLIDPNLHSCGTVPPHGVVELTQPERNFFVIGAKSYGRAPTFLMATGYEQARSVVAELAGNPVAARQVQLVLPETGVCNVNLAAETERASSCCGGPAKSETACCVADETAKAAGESGCGCAAAAPPVRMTAESV